MTHPPGSRQDAPVNRNGTGASAATWAWAAVVVAIIDTVALAATAIITTVESIHVPSFDDGGVVNLVAAPTFPLLAALMLRDRDAATPRTQDRLAWLFL